MKTKNKKALELLDRATQEFRLFVANLDDVSNELNSMNFGLARDTIKNLQRDMPWKVQNYIEAAKEQLQ